MSTATLQCTSCGKDFDVLAAPLLCGVCKKGLLQVRHNLGRVRERVNRYDIARGPKSLWRYVELLPVERESITTLGEGMTPLVRSENLGREWGLTNLSFKLEYSNPTGSFKDRGTSVSVSVLRASGAKEVFDDSSGNAGSSLAAYCARAGIACTIYAPSNASEQKLAQTRVYGAKVVKVKGPRAAASRAALRAWRAGKGSYASHLRSPFFIEGTKTLAFEVAEEHRWDVPDHMVFPVGGGSLLLGAFKGFTELSELNWTKGIPKLHCIQAQTCSPIVDAYQRGRSDVVPAHESTTIAAGIMITDPPWGRQVLEALKSSGGSAVAVSDGEILEAQRLLARCEGLFAEPTSCAALAGLKKLIEKGEISGDESVVLPLTGSGLKQVGTLRERHRRL